MKQTVKGQWLHIATKEIPVTYNDFLFFFSAMWVVRNGNRLPRKVVESPPLEIVRAWLDKALSNLIQVIVVSKELDQMTLKAPFNLNYTVIYGVYG